METGEQCSPKAPKCSCYKLLHAQQNIKKMVGVL